MEEKIRMQGNKTGQDSKIECQACTEKAPAVSKCIDCDHCLCQECQRAHERMKMMKSHTLIPLQSGEATYLRKPSRKCKKHSNQDISYFCDTCLMHVCLKCSIKDHVRPMHSLKNLKEAREQCKQEVADLVFKVENNNSKMIDACAVMEKSREKLDIMFANTIEKISNKAEKEIGKAVGRIREEEKKLKQTAEENYNDRVETFKQALTQNFNMTTRTKSKLDEAKQVMIHLNDDMIEYVKTKMLHSLEEFSIVEAEHVSNMLSFIDFEAGDASLGRLILKEEPHRKNIQQQPIQVLEKSPPSNQLVSLGQKWALKTDVKTFGFEKTKFRQAYNVAAFSNNDVVIAETELKILVTFNTSDPPTDFPRRLRNGSLSNPCEITVGKNNQLVVVDGPDVKILSRDCQLLHQFTPGKGSDGAPSCLAVDDKDTIAVGYKNEISLHHMNGTLIRKLPAPMLGRFLTICRQQFIYTNERMKLVSLHFDGHLVFSVDVPTRYSPMGVSCDQDGNIYVAVNHWASGSIHRFTPDGKYSECIIKDCRAPHNITFTPSGELVLAAKDSVQIYHQV